MALVIQPATRARAKADVPLAVVRGGKRDGHLLVHTVAAPDSEQLITLSPPEVFELIPESRPGMRSVMHVVGPSGVGKSSVAAGFMRNFQLQWPEGRILVISSVCDPDPAYEGIEHTRVPIDEELPLVTMAEIAATSNGSPSCLVFDDVEGLPKKRQEALRIFQQHALEVGRKLHLHCLNIFHRCASGKSTSSSLSESNSIIYFPANPTSNLDYALKAHLGIDKVVRQVLKDGFGRWVQLRVDSAPSVVVGEQRAAIWDPDAIAAALKKLNYKERAIATAEIRRELAEEAAEAHEDPLTDDIARFSHLRRAAAAAAPTNSRERSLARK